MAWPQPYFILSPRDHVRAALIKLHWLSVTHRIQYKSSLMMFQCPDYMSNTVSLVSDDPGRRRLRSATSTDYHVPRTRTKLGDRAFSIAGLKTWNNLPQSVRSADSLESFKQKLKFYLFNSCFNVWIIVCMCTPVMPYRPGFSLQTGHKTSILWLLWSTTELLNGSWPLMPPAPYHIN